MTDGWFESNEVALCSPFFVKIRTAGLFPSVALPLGAIRGFVLPSISPRMYVVYASMPTHTHTREKIGIASLYIATHFQ